MPVLSWVVLNSTARRSMLGASTRNRVNPASCFRSARGALYTQPVPRHLSPGCTLSNLIICYPVHLTVLYALSYITTPREGEAPVPPRTTPGLRRSYGRDKEDQTDLDENAHRGSDSKELEGISFVSFPTSCYETSSTYSSL